MFTEDFIKSYDEEGDVGYLLVVDVEYPKTLHMLHSDLSFLPEKMKINKCPKLVCNSNDKENYSIRIVALKQALKIGKNKNVLGKFKDELGGKILTKFCALRAKTYSFLIDKYTDDNYEKNKIVNKKAKEQKNVLFRERSYLIIILIHCLKIKYCIDHNNDLEVMITKCTQKKSIR